MKIHKLLVEKIVDTLVAVFTTTIYVDKAIEKRFKDNRKWGSRDRRFFAESVFDCVRFRRRFWSMAGLPDAEYLDESKIDVESVFRLWLAYFYEKTGVVPEFAPREYVDALIIGKKFPLAIEQSYPDWIFELIKENYPNDLEAILKSMNQVAPVFLRVNELKATVAQVSQELVNEGIAVEPVKNLPTALKLVEKKNVFGTQAFHKGFFEVQDGGSQMISLLVDARPGMRVVDACAGAGGKSLHLASNMKNKGKIISLDIHERRLQDLRTRATRNGVDIIEQKVIESQKVIKRLENSFDRVLLDVPCSGLGVIRRNPDSKWKFKKEDLENLLITQQDILNNYAQMMKKDGKLVYATCSLLPSENELQVKKFLEKHSDWKLEHEFHVRPDKTQFDGFYAACLVRN